MSKWREIAARLLPSFLKPSPFDACWEIIYSVYRARALYVAAELQIADLLAHGPKSVPELASATGADETHLYRLLRALSACGIFKEQGSGYFGFTEAAAPLCSESEGSVRDWILLTGSKPVWNALAEADRVVRTGKNGFALAHGPLDDLYQFGRKDEAFSETFVSGMDRVTDWQRHAIVSAYDFASFATIVDVGGGRGSLISSLLRRCPRSRGILFDQPHTLDMAEAVLATEGVRERCELIRGSFFDRIPPGGDAYVLKCILRDWDDQAALTILENCHRAMGASAVLLLMDAILNPRGDRDHFVKLLDLEQMFWLNGTLRTGDEWQHLLANAGFRIQRCVRTKVVDIHIIEAVKL